MLINREVILLLICTILFVLECYSKASYHGPGHRKGLYGISKRKPKKNLDKALNSTSSKAPSSLPATKAGSGKAGERKVEVKGHKRAIIEELHNEEDKSSAGVDYADFEGPKKRDVSLKEVKVGYKKTLKDKSPENSTQVIEITGNLTSSEHSSNQNGYEKESSKASSHEDKGTGQENNSNEARSASSNIITDLKVPQMGAAIFGNTQNNNGSESKEASADRNSTSEVATKQQETPDTRTSSSNMITDLKVPNIIDKTVPNSSISNSNGSQVTDGNASENVNQRSPQVPNLGASIIGIVDNSNGSLSSNRETLLSNNTAEGNSTDLKERQTEGGADSKLKDFLDTLDEIANTTAETARLVNTLRNASIAQEKGAGNQTESAATADYTAKAGKDVSAKKKHEIIGPHYYEPECDDKKKCPDGHYCRMYVCVECHRSKHACTHREQCCNKMECVYGRCENKPKGSPGAFCEKDSECAGEACCVLEPTVDEEHSICKPKLSEFHQCSPILFRKIWIGDHKPECGPCKGGLTCVQRGVEGNHEVCMKKS